MAEFVIVEAAVCAFGALFVALALIGDRQLRKKPLARAAAGFAAIVFAVSMAAILYVAAMMSYGYID